MDKKNLLLEIGTEEIPAHAMPAILNQLKTLGEKSLTESRIELGIQRKELGYPLLKKSAEVNA